MRTYGELNDQISQIVADGGSLLPLKRELENHVAKIDSFLDKFLAKFGSRVMGDRDESPEWKLYTAKTDEYNTYMRAIRNIDYFIAKSKLA